MRLSHVLKRARLFALAQPVYLRYCSSRVQRAETVVGDHPCGLLRPAGHDSTPYSVCFAVNSGNGKFLHFVGPQASNETTFARLDLFTPHELGSGAAAHGHGMSLKLQMALGEQKLADHNDSQGITLMCLDAESPQIDGEAPSEPQLGVLARRHRPLETLAIRTPLPAHKAQSVANLSKPASHRTRITRKSKRDAAAEERAGGDQQAQRQRHHDSGSSFPQTAARVPCAPGEQLLMLAFLRAEPVTGVGRAGAGRSDGSNAEPERVADHESTSPGSNPGAASIGYDISEQSRAWVHCMVPCEVLAVGSEHVLAAGCAELASGGCEEESAAELRLLDEAVDAQLDPASVLLLRMGGLHASGVTSELARQYSEGGMLLSGAPLVARRSGEMVAHVPIVPSPALPDALARRGLLVATGSGVLLRRLDQFDEEAAVALGMRPGQRSEHHSSQGREQMQPSGRLTAGGVGEGGGWADDDSPVGRVHGIAVECLEQLTAGRMQAEEAAALLREAGIPLPLAQSACERAVLAREEGAVGRLALELAAAAAMAGDPTGESIGDRLGYGPGTLSEGDWFRY